MFRKRFYSIFLNFFVYLGLYICLVIVFVLLLLMVVRNFCFYRYFICFKELIFIKIEDLFRKWIKYWKKCIIKSFFWYMYFFSKLMLLLFLWLLERMVLDPNGPYISTSQTKVKKCLSVGNFGILTLARPSLL